MPTPRSPLELLEALDGRRRSRSRPTSATSRSTRCAGCSRCCGTARSTPPTSLVTCGGGMGSLLGPADGLYHDLGVQLAARGIGTMRVGYRKPNDLVALRARRRGRGRPRGPARRASLRRRWATRSAARSRSRPARCSATHCRGVVTLVDAVGRVRGRGRARRDSAAAASTAPTTRSSRRRRARSCRCSPGTARSCCSRATGHLLTKRPTELRERLARMDPRAPRGVRRV